MLYCSLIPETKGRSLEDMDIIFGSVSAEVRAANVIKQEKAREDNDRASIEKV